MTKAHGVTEQELQGLSAEERAALESEDESAAAAGKDEKEEKDEQDEGSTDAADKDEAAAAGGAKDDEEKDEKDEAAPDKEAEDEQTKVAAAESGDEPFAVPFHHQATMKPEDVKAQLDDLKAKYDAGEIQLDDFLAKRDDINRAVITDQVATSISEQSKTQMGEALWQRAVDDFMDSHSAYKDQVLRDALDARVKVLAKDPANDKLSDRQLLTKAHEEVASRFKVADDKAAPPDPKKAAADKRKADLSNVPKTIAGAPAAADNNAADDEFSELDRLSELGTADSQAAYERRLAAMTQDQQDRYLRGSVIA